MTLPTVLVYYLEIFIFPWQAGPAHDVRFVTTPGIGNFYFPTALLLVLVLVSYLAFRNSAHRALYLFCAAWWLVTLAPALHVNFRQESRLFYFHDRFEYLSSFAFCLLLANLAMRAGFRRQGIAAASLVLAVLYGGFVWRTEHIWHDDLTLYTRCVEIVPDSPTFRTHLAMALFREHQPAAAIRLQLND
jgi:hypothetical protein